MRYSRGWKKTKMMGNHLYTLLAGAPEVLRKRVLVDEWILILSVKKIWNNISFIFFLKTDFSEKIFYFKNAIYAFLQQKSSEILRMFKIRIMTQTVIEMQFLPSQHSNAEEISSRMQKGSIFKKMYRKYRSSASYVYFGFALSSNQWDFEVWCEYLIRQFFVYISNLKWTICSMV